MEKPIRILRRTQVLDRIGLKTSTLYDMVSKGEFPAPIKLGVGIAVGWIEQEVDDYLSQRVTASRVAK